jgi:hypothetical protein
MRHRIFGIDLAEGKGMKSDLDDAREAGKSSMTCDPLHILRGRIYVVNDTVSPGKIRQISTRHQ